MEHLLLPSAVTFEATARPNEMKAIIEPCYHGYGTTLGNAFRRVLLSSLPGAAVTAVKIKGVTHEFQAVESVQEDVVEIILNLKMLRLKVFSDQEIRLHLLAKGTGPVTARAIAPNADVEIVNPDLVIAHSTESTGEIEMEIFVSQGRGYLPVEERNKRDLELGTMSVDAVFTPVLNVAYTVELTRVGDITNYERLILTIETDGTITPKEALVQSADILMDHFSVVQKFCTNESSAVEEVNSRDEAAVEENQSTEE